MCGITCLISKREINKEDFKKRNDVISHRGPDGEGFEYFENEDYKIAFGHRRLAILDLSSNGLQPMTCFQRYTIIFNGEVYNYIELRNELKEYEFKTGTDTEVIVAAYDRWGTKCFEKFNGMWTIIIYDSISDKIIISRDRFGIKPLYYVENEQDIIFGSEIKQVVGKTVRPNRELIYDYLVHGIQDHTNETMFEGVRQFRAGCFAVIDLKEESYKLEFIPYFDINQKIEKQGLKKRFFNSIKLRLRSDVPVGSCLSGGLDSSSIVYGLATEVKKENIFTFTSVSKHKKFDETQFSDIVVEDVGAKNFKVEPQFNSLVAELDKIIWHQDEPFTSTSIFAQWEIFKCAKENNIKVMLDGQGADEVLSGYHQFFKSYLFSYLQDRRYLDFFRELRKIIKNNNMSWKFCLEVLILYYLPEFIIQKIRSIFNKNNSKPNWIRNDVKSRPDPRTYEYVKNLNKHCEMQLKTTNLPMLLHYEDRNSMASSIEARVPFLDFELVLETMSTNYSERMSDGLTKTLLRREMKDLVNDEILERKDKMGFVTAEEIWFKNNASEVEGMIHSALERISIINKHIIIEDFKKFLSDKKSYNFAFWRIICLGRWLKLNNIEI
ncbi:asparagine synthase (glutamine-hydrolyzing) [Bacteriovorax sp. Seq25_V]|uniref:asparagine synthase (glutamine-hydrolyzing) n=1 Tax=Bacteriovorax sp. Seq25_V TaxID=1201288 RepID=UPI00038A2A6B|nr:asparagine synthase (glutamine-hydrolyzing) [Bacteriovorax sp. Seq25_V]EQC43242.1 asparagine synthase (glutamine-hydrolyzing) [Bacteriovorax sp. Seq25_V]